MALLELQNITAGYDKNVILKDLNFQVEKGELVSLLGSSGCGKNHYSASDCRFFPLPWRENLSLTTRIIPRFL